MFTKEEDIYLQFLVSKYGESNWDLIASEMGNRTPRQCRDRFRNYLSPRINVTKWTEEEDKLLIQKHSEFGPHWKRIAVFFNSRTDVNIKNRFNFLMTQQNQLQKKALNSSSQISPATSTPEIISINNNTDINMKAPAQINSEIIIQGSNATNENHNKKSDDAYDIFEMFEKYENYDSFGGNSVDQAFTSDLVSTIWWNNF